MVVGNLMVTGLRHHVRVTNRERISGSDRHRVEVWEALLKGYRSDIHTIVFDGALEIYLETRVLEFGLKAQRRR